MFKLTALYLKVLMFIFCNIDANFHMMSILVYKTSPMIFSHFQNLY